MKNRSIFLNLITFVVLLFFATSLMYSIGVTTDFGIIISKLKVIGFQTGNIVKQKNGSYKVNVIGFAQTSKAITFSKGTFIPFQMNVKLVRNTLYISKSDLKNYSINSKYLVSDIKIVSRLFRLKPIQLKPIPFQPQIYTSKLDQGDVEFYPAVLKINYGNNILNLNNGTNGSIQIPETSNLIDSNGDVLVTIKFTLKNKTSKNFRFNMHLNYDGKWIFIKKVLLLKNKTITITKTLKLTPHGTQYKAISVQGPVGISDDTHISFFYANLMLRVYAI